MSEIDRYHQLMQRPNAVFVFGSNKAGLHGAGAAKAAHRQYGAIWGVGEGHAGSSYAIPTVGKIGQTLELLEIQVYVTEFLDYARSHPENSFVLTRIGCVLAGFSDEEIAPLFIDAPANVIQPDWGIAGYATPEASHQPGPGPGGREASGGAEGVRAPDPATQTDGAR